MLIEIAKQLADRTDLNSHEKIIAKMLFVANYLIRPIRGDYYEVNTLFEETPVIDDIYDHLTLEDKVKYNEYVKLFKESIKTKVPFKVPTDCAVFKRVDMMFAGKGWIVGWDIFDDNHFLINIKHPLVK